MKRNGTIGCYFTCTTGTGRSPIVVHSAAESALPALRATVSGSPTVVATSPLVWGVGLRLRTEPADRTAKRHRSQGRGDSQRRAQARTQAHSGALAPWCHGPRTVGASGLALALTSLRRKGSQSRRQSPSAAAPTPDALPAAAAATGAAVAPACTSGRGGASHRNHQTAARSPG